MPGVFIDLYHLLDEYAPLWYTKQLHEKADSVLRYLKKF